MSELIDKVRRAHRYNTIFEDVHRQIYRGRFVRGIRVNRWRQFNTAAELKRRYIWSVESGIAK